MWHWAVARWPLCWRRSLVEARRQVVKLEAVAQRQKFLIDALRAEQAHTRWKGGA